jgi:TRAP transporter TAXI family solute receptor
MLDASRPAASDAAARQATARAGNKLARRIRRMLRHTWLIVAGAGLALAGVTALTFYLLSQPTVLKIAVGPPGSEDARLAQNLAQHLARERANIRLSVALQGSPAEAADALDTGQTDLAIVRRDLIMPRNGQAIAVLRNNMVVFVVLPPAAQEPATARKTKAPQKKIEKIEDLAGQRLGVFGRLDANVRLLHVILKAHDIAPEKIAVTQAAPADLFPAIREGKFDAVMAVGPLGSRIVTEIVSAATRGKQLPTFLPIATAEAIAHRNPVYEVAEIPAGAFGPKRPQDAIDTIAFAHYIVARRSLDEQTAAEFTRLLFAARQSLAGDAPAFSKIEAPDTDKDAAVPAHPGTVAYFDGESKTFLDRYSESLYWGLMLLSFVGSGAAWLLSYAKSDERERNLDAIEQLLGLMAAARSARSLAELESLRNDADAILKRTLRRIEANALDEGVLAAFKLTLDQTQRAISDRQMLLLGPGDGTGPL